MLKSVLSQLFRGSTPAAATLAAEEHVDEGRRHLDAKRYPQAAEAFARALRSAPGHADGLLGHGLASLRAGEPRTAVASLEKLVERLPDNATGQFLLGAAFQASGNAAAAERHCRRALALQADYYDAHLLLADILLPGPQYLEWLRRLHEHLKPRTYVEIGIAAGRSLAVVGAGTSVIGIDPAPRFEKAPIPDVRVFRERSDDFFARHDLRAEFGGRPVDLAFIDGMHQCEFALRDFMNLERWCTPESVILIHDCYPLDAPSASREQRTTFWTGDVWRVMACLAKHRPDLSVRTIATGGSGLGIVTRLDPQSNVIRDRLPALTDEMLAMDFAALERDRSSLLRLVENDWDAVLRLLPASARPA